MFPRVSGYLFYVDFYWRGFFFFSFWWTRRKLSWTPILYTRSEWCWVHSNLPNTTLVATTKVHVIKEVCGANMGG
jgi:hypothetical protein